MKRLYIILGLMVTFNAFASTENEIEHLLTFVGMTQCQYERNGDVHTGVEAIEHIKRKADYYSGKINSAEDFIQYAATKSEFSGKFYQVHCEGQPPIKSRDWLLGELIRYRESLN